MQSEYFLLVEIKSSVFFGIILIIIESSKKVIKRHMMTGKPNKIKVKIKRGSGQSSITQEFEVPEQDNQTVLDLVTYIQEYIDPTVSYRFACRVGMCGSCGMMVNGEPRWTCRTHVKKVLGSSKTIEVGPLKNLPVIRDLVVDMDPFFDKWIAVGGVHHPSKNRHQSIEKIDETSVERTLANDAVECINCGVCYASCDVVSANNDYFGPAALNRAWSLVNDVKTKNKDSILEAVSSNAGCHNCHSQQNCSNYCPNELNPSASIASLKRTVMTSKINNLFGSVK